ncbi:MAG: type II secretion system F family protein [Alistipes sp.]|nr:type II secretion system F family protein [Alistipes sp.]MBP3455110.1 type II secretion system F family protein [Alistipes sp.]
MKKNGHKLSDARRQTLYAQLHALLTAGLDFSAAFRLLIDSEEERRTKALIEEIYAAAVRGLPLAEAMRDSGAFSAMECGVIGIGDRTGRLTQTLDFLHDYYRKRAAQRRMISSAVSYPAVILAVAVAVVAFMLAVVVPMFEQVYARMGGELPALTRWIITVSRAFPSCAAVTLTAAAGAYLLYRMNRQREEVQRRRAWLVLRIPFAGMIVRKNMQAHCCKLLCLLCASGIPLLAGIDMLRDVMTFYPYRKSLGEIARMLERGETLAAALARYPELYDRRLAAIVRVAEETNRLPEMLRQQGDALTAEMEYAIRRMGTMLEPMLIMLVGVLVAVILVAMYMPMFSLGSIMG